MKFSGRHFPKDVILTTIRWYLRYKLSYRDIEELIAERGIEVDHSTLNRGVIKYSPLLVTEARNYKRSVGVSWRFDETYIKVRGSWKYLSLRFLTFKSTNSHSGYKNEPSSPGAYGCRTGTDPTNRMKSSRHSGNAGPDWR